MLLQTPLYTYHRDSKAQLVPFADWEMPLHYGSQIHEHHQVRQHAGIFDVSHMGVVDISGSGSLPYLRHMFANDVAKIQGKSKALYTCMLNDDGGVIDDLIVYHLAEDYYRLVINASRRQCDIDWLHQHAKDYTITLTERDDLAMIAVQGPEAINSCRQVFPENIYENINQLKPFHCLTVDDLLIARTGYTGEDGIEIILPNDQALNLWQQFISCGVTACGLGARDTLRLEAGLNLYGADMDEKTSPLVSNLAWTVSWEDAGRDFVGKGALTKQKEQGIDQCLVGVILESPGLLRNQQKIYFSSAREGVITSGGFSPTLKCGIGLARVPIDEENVASIERRNQRLPIKIISLPFVRRGAKAF